MALKHRAVANVGQVSEIFRAKHDCSSCRTNRPPWVETFVDVLSSNRRLHLWKGEMRYAT